MISRFTWFMGVAIVALHGQVPETHGHITGSVGDPTGAVIPHASIIVRSATTSKILAKAMADEQGNYTVLDVTTGTYEVQFDARGFKPVVRRRVIVRTGEETVVPQPRLPVSLDEAICILTVTPAVPRKPKKPRK